MRVGKIVKLKPNMASYYISLHANPWPEVEAALKRHHLHRFSIFRVDDLLFSFYEYDGDDYTADMASLARETEEWLRETDACQEAYHRDFPGLWEEMEEVFFLA